MSMKLVIPEGQATSLKGIRIEVAAPKDNAQTSSQGNSSNNSHASTRDCTVEFIPLTKGEQLKGFTIELDVVEGGNLSTDGQTLPTHLMPITPTLSPANQSNVNLPAGVALLPSTAPEAGRHGFIHPRSGLPFKDEGNINVPNQELEAAHLQQHNLFGTAH